MRYKLTVSYDGSAFCGFQRQKDKRTVQGEIERALKAFTGEDITVMASGRTDAGVHALGQVIHFSTLKEFEPRKICRALGYFLPPDIAALNAEAAPNGFHAVKSAKQKTYFYDIYFSGVESPILKNRAAVIKDTLDTAAMKKACSLFTGEHDFKQFCCTGSSAQTTVRRVYGCRIEDITPYGFNGLRLYVTANGFIYKMVRLIAGALIALGKGELTESDIESFLNGCVWKKKMPAVAEGLYLYSVVYDE
jgi:tRNA pseudouridine38-40 synthase